MREQAQGKMADWLWFRAGRCLRNLAFALCLATLGGCFQVPILGIEFESDLEFGVEYLLATPRASDFLCTFVDIGDGTRAVVAVERSKDKVQGLVGAIRFTNSFGGEYLQVRPTHEMDEGGDLESVDDPMFIIGRWQVLEDRREWRVPKTVPQELSSVTSSGQLTFALLVTHKSIFDETLVLTDFEPDGVDRTRQRALLRDMIVALVGRDADSVRGALRDAFPDAGGESEDGPPTGGPAGRADAGLCDPGQPVYSNVERHCSADGKAMFRTFDGRDWIFANGTKVPESEEPSD